MDQNTTTTTTTPIIPTDLRLEGSIHGAPFCVIEPTRFWNGNILLFAHGYRPIGGSRGVKDVEIDDQGACYKQLLKEGWVVAATMYRRHGVIIKDAAQDLINLRNFLVQRYESQFGVTLKYVIVEGQSMGGAIATRLAERYPELFSGVLAIGAALMTREDRMNVEDREMVLLKAPVVPILYLINDGELGPVQKYIEEVKRKIMGSESQVARAGPGDEYEVILPALWTVARSGHNWTNQTERLEAIKGLCKWLDFGTFITQRAKEGTQPSELRKSSAVWKEGGKVAEGRVMMVGEKRFKTSFTEEDWMRLGIRHPGVQFELTILGSTLSVMFDEYPYIHSTTNDLIALLDADHREVLFIVHNVAEYASISDCVGRIAVGDSCSVRLYPRPIGRLSCRDSPLNSIFSSKQSEKSDRKGEKEEELH